MKLPQISDKELVIKFMRFGFVVTRQRGSHIRIEKNIKIQNNKNYNSKSLTYLKRNIE